MHFEKKIMSALLLLFLVRGSTLDSPQAQLRLLPVTQCLMCFCESSLPNEVLAVDVLDPDTCSPACQAACGKPCAVRAMSSIRNEPYEFMRKTFPKLSCLDGMEGGRHASVIGQALDVKLLIQDKDVDWYAGDQDGVLQVGEMLRFLSTLGYNHSIACDAPYDGRKRIALFSARPEKTSRLLHVSRINTAEWTYNPLPGRWWVSKIGADLGPFLHQLSAISGGLYGNPYVCVEEST